MARNAPWAASDAVKLDIYLGMLPVSSKPTLAIFFRLATRSIPHGNGFGVEMSIASCQIKGMRLGLLWSTEMTPDCKWLGINSD